MMPIGVNRGPRVKPKTLNLFVILRVLNTCMVPCKSLLLKISPSAVKEQVSNIYGFRLMLSAKTCMEKLSNVTKQLSKSTGV